MSWDRGREKDGASPCAWEPVGIQLRTATPGVRGTFPEKRVANEPTKVPQAGVTCLHGTSSALEFCPQHCCVPAPEVLGRLIPPFGRSVSGTKGISEMRK